MQNDVYPRYKDAYPKTKRFYPIREAQLQKSITMSLVPMTKFPAGDNYDIFSENSRPDVNPFVGMSAFPEDQSPRQAPRESGEPERWPSQGKEDNANQNFNYDHKTAFPNHS